MIRTRFATALLALCALLPVGAHAQALPSPRVQTPSANDNSNRAASTNYVDSAAQVLSSAIADRSSKSSRNVWSYAPAYDLASNVLAVQNYWSGFDLTIPPGKQFNFFRFDGKFRGGDKAKLFSADIDVYGSDDAYAFIAALNNFGSGPVKSLYGAVTMRPASQGGVGVGLVANTGADTGSKPNTLWNVQMSKHGDSSGVVDGNDAFFALGSNNKILSIFNGVYESDYGLFANRTVGFSKALIRAHNHTIGLDGAVVYRIGSFLEWWDVNNARFKVDNLGSLSLYDTANKQLFGVSAVDGRVSIGTSDAPQRELRFNGTTSAKTFLMQQVEATNSLRIFGVGRSIDLLRVKGDALTTGTTALQISANPSGTTAVSDVVVGAADSCGTGFRCLRIAN